MCSQVESSIRSVKLGELALSAWRLQVVLAQTTKDASS